MRGAESQLQRSRQGLLNRAAELLRLWKETCFRPKNLFRSSGRDLDFGIMCFVFCIFEGVFGILECVFSFWKVYLVFWKVYLVFCAG